MVSIMQNVENMCYISVYSKQVYQYRNHSPYTLLMFSKMVM
jgi:hypothetical protein